MHVRSLFIALSATLLLAGMGLFTLRAGDRLREGFAEAEAFQQQAVLHFARTVVASTRFQARSAQRRWESEPGLGRALLEGDRKSLARYRDALTQETGAAVAFAPAPDSLPPGHSVAPFLRGENGGPESLRFVDGAPLLSARFPIRLYEEPLGNLELTFALNDGTADAIFRATGTRATFVAEGTPGSTALGMEDLPHLAVKLEGAPLVRVSRTTRQSVLGWGALCLAILTVLLYAGVEWLFFRRFRQFLGEISLGAQALERGEIRELTPPAGGVRELRRLREVFATYTRSLRRFQERVTEKSATEAVGKVAAQVAHDLRSPLAALQVCLDQKALAHSPQDRDSLIRATVQRIQAIADGLRPRPVRSDSAPNTPCALVPLVRSLWEEKRTQYGHLSHIQIQADLPCTEVTAQVEGKELARVLSNLVDNAVEALGDGGSVTLRLLPLEDRCLLEVEDTGPGIAEELRPRLFERGATFGKPGGSGLGLWHARECVRRWQGEIDLEAGDHGLGTVVTLTLPTLPSATTAARGPSPFPVFVLGWWLTTLASAAPTSLPALLEVHRLVGLPPLPAPSVAGLVLEGNTEVLPIDRTYLQRLLQLSFARGKRPLKVLPPDFTQSVERGSAAVEDLLCPKYSVYLHTDPSGAVEVELAWLELHPEGEGLRVHRTWERRHRLGSATLAHREEELSRLLQRETRQLLAEVPRQPSVDGDPTPPLHTPYTLLFRDTESSRPLLGVGVTVGAPLPVELRAELLGTADLPLYAGLSGTYLGIDRRGLRMDVGILVDRLGDLKHGPLLMVGRHSETWTTTTQIPKERGRSATETTTRQFLRAYTGPGYQVRWKDFSLSAGALVPIQRGPQGSPLFLLQVGYVPLFVL